MTSQNLCKRTTPPPILEYFIGFVATKHVVVNRGMERGKKVGVQHLEGKGQGTTNNSVLLELKKNS